MPSKGQIFKYIDNPEDGGVATTLIVVEAKMDDYLSERGWVNTGHGKNTGGRQLRTIFYSKGDKTKRINLMATKEGIKITSIKNLKIEEG